MNNDNTLIESEVTCEIVVTRANGTVEPAIMARAVRSRKSRLAVLSDLSRHTASRLREAIRQWRADDTDF